MKKKYHLYYAHAAIIEDITWMAARRNKFYVRVLISQHEKIIIKLHIALNKIPITGFLGKLIQSFCKDCKTFSVVH